jgi:hypothetical protein
MVLRAVALFLFLPLVVFGSENCRRILGSFPIEKFSTRTPKIFGLDGRLSIPIGSKSFIAWRQRTGPWIPDTAYAFPYLQPEQVRNWALTESMALIKEEAAMNPNKKLTVAGIFSMKQIVGKMQRRAKSKKLGVVSSGGLKFLCIKLPHSSKRRLVFFRDDDFDHQAASFDLGAMTGTTILFGGHFVMEGDVNKKKLREISRVTIDQGTWTHTSKMIGLPALEVIKKELEGIALVKPETEIEATRFEDQIFRRYEGNKMLFSQFVDLFQPGRAEQILKSEKPMRLAADDGDWPTSAEQVAEAVIASWEGDAEFMRALDRVQQRGGAFSILVRTIRDHEENLRIAYSAKTREEFAAQANKMAREIIEKTIIDILDGQLVGPASIRSELRALVQGPLLVLHTIDQARLKKSETWGAKMEDAFEIHDGLIQIMWAMNVLQDHMNTFMNRGISWTTDSFSSAVKDFAYYEKPYHIFDTIRAAALSNLALVHDNQVRIKVEGDQGPAISNRAERDQLEFGLREVLGRLFPLAKRESQVQIFYDSSKSELVVHVPTETATAEIFTGLALPHLHVEQTSSDGNLIARITLTNSPAPDVLSQ